MRLEINIMALLAFAGPLMDTKLRRSGGFFQQRMQLAYNFIWKNWQKRLYIMY
jgi:hypothetical protein